MALALARRCAGTRSRPGTDDKSRSGQPLPRRCHGVDTGELMRQSHTEISLGGDESLGERAVRAAHQRRTVRGLNTYIERLPAGSTGSTK